MEIIKLGSQSTVKGPEDWFTGSVRINYLFQPNGHRRAGASQPPPDNIKNIGASKSPKPDSEATTGSTLAKGHSSLRAIQSLCQECRTHALNT